MTLLVLGLLVIVLGFVLHRRAPDDPSRVPFAVVLLAYVGPALFLGHTLFTSRDAAVRIRAALLGVGFRGAPGETLRVPVGGDRDRDAVWISALAETTTGSPRLGHLVLRPSSSDEAGTLTFEPVATRSSGLLGLRRPGEPLAPLRSVALADGDRITVGERVWEVELETGLLGPPAALVDGEGHAVELPRRYGELPLGPDVRIWRPLGGVLRTHPLAWLEKSLGGEAGDLADFLFWHDAELRVTVTDPRVSVERAGALVEPSEALDGTVHVLSWPRWDGEGFEAGGFRDRRSLRPLVGRHSFALEYETPEIVILTEESLRELAVEPLREASREPVEGAGTGGDDPASADGNRADSDTRAAGDDRAISDDRAARDEVVRVSLSMGGWQVTDKSLYFRHTSRAVALEALAALTLPVGRERRGELTAATPRGQRHGRFGEPIWLGGDHLAAVQLDVLRPPVLLGLLALALAVLKALAARAGRLSSAQLVFAASLEVLVTVRLLVGFRVWVLPPFAQEAFELALVAWVLLPWAFLLASAPAGGRLGEDSADGRLSALKPALPALGGAVFAASWCWSFSGGLRALVWEVALAAALGAWAIRATGALDRLRDVVAERLDRLDGRSERRTLLLWSAAAFVPGLMRLALLFLGNRESLLVGGQRFALTLVHLPLALALEAAYLVWLWRRIGDRGRLAPLDLVPAAALIVGTWLLPALFVSDLGLVLLHLPVFLLALASVALSTGGRLAGDGGSLRSRWLHALPAAVLVVFVLVAALPIGARAVLAVIPKEKARQLESERNYLRLLSFAYPQRLESVARRTSEELSVMSTVMRTYTSGPFGGRGWMGSELSPHIQATALREHAPAVFVAAEWGLAGILGVLLAFAVLGSSARGLAPWRDEDPPSSGALPFWSVASVLAALTLAVPSVYMIFANYRLTLFTGKNTYLLGLDSTADVLEVFLLTLLYAVGAARLRDSAEV